MDTKNLSFGQGVLVFVGIIVAAVIIAIAMSSGTPPQDQQPAPMQPKEVTRIDELTKELLSREEIEVKDVFLNDAKFLYVAVPDNGADRTEMAKYICMVTKDFGGGVEKVRMVEVGTMNTEQADNAYGRFLGEARCE